jgi:2-polyprenyl-3-methyl-5-hydroxy-6-metoxy-1,4-benzoquinol methylase
MPLRIDPELNEIRALEAVTNWNSLQVLEIGCGDGRLTQRLAELGASVHAIDPDAALVRKARKALPNGLAGRVRFKAGSAERLAHPNEAFDAVIFAWAL